MYILENGFKGYITTCKPKYSGKKCLSELVFDEDDYYWESCTPKKREDNRKYAYIYTKKGRTLATVDTKTYKAYKVEGCLRKTWKPIRRFTFGKWAIVLNW